MTREDLEKLEIGLELYKLEAPLDGEFDRLISTLVKMIRHDIARIRREETAKTEKASQ